MTILRFGVRLQAFAAAKFVPAFAAISMVQRRQGREPCDRAKGRDPAAPELTAFVCDKSRNDVEDNAQGDREGGEDGGAQAFDTRFRLEAATMTAST